jgi:hypothetical protein
LRQQMVDQFIDLIPGQGFLPNWWHWLLRDLKNTNIKNTFYCSTAANGEGALTSPV